MPAHSRGYKFLLLLILALVIRLPGILSRPIWYDEAFSILLSEKGPASILAGTLSTDADVSAAEEHPPAYYFMLWGWIQVFGTSLVSIRSLSILAGLGITALTYCFGKRLFNENTAVAAGLLVAILPIQVHYSQEVRMYVFTALWLTLATFAFWQGKQTGSFKWWVVFTLSAALAQYTHNLAGLYLILLALIPILQRDWKTLRATVLAGVACLILVSPWLVQLPAQFAKIEHNFWIGKPGIDRLFTLFLLYIPNLPLPGFWLIPALFFSMLIIALAFYQTYLAIRHKIKDSQMGVWLAYLSFAPPLLLWALSQIKPVYVERALLPAQVMFCLWLAWTLVNTNLHSLIRNLSVFSIIISAVMGFYQHLTYSGFPYAPYSNVDAYLRVNLKPGDVIVHSNKLSLLPAVYYDRDLQQSFITDPPGSGTDTLSPATRQVLGLTAAQDVGSAVQGASRIWFIIFQQSIDEFTRAGYRTHTHLKYLDEHFKLASVSDWGDLRIFLYTKEVP
jgi:mannosyltransferase